MSDAYSNQGDDFQLPEGFSVDPPQPKLPQGFSYQPTSQMQPQVPVDQTDWRGMLDNFAQPASYDVWEGQQQQRGLRGQEKTTGIDEADMPVAPRAPTQGGTESGHTDDRGEDIFGAYERDPTDTRDPRDIRMVGAGRNRVGLPDVRDYGIDEDKKLYPDVPGRPQEQQAGGWRGMFDELFGVKSAEARPARKPSQPAPQPEPGQTPPADNRIGSKREDGAVWDGSRWVSEQDMAQQARESAATRTAGRRGREGAPKPDQEPPSRGWFNETVQALERWGVQAQEGFSRRIEQAEAESEGKPLMERMEAYNRAFDPGPIPQSRVGYGEAVGQVFGEAKDMMAQHWDNLKNNFGKDWLQHPFYNSLAALGNAAMIGIGPVGMGLSPLGGAYRTIVSDPAEQMTGLPKWATEAALGLATPGVGLPGLGPKTSGAIGAAAGFVGRGVTKIPGVTEGKRLIQSEFFPQTMLGGQEFRADWQQAMGLAAQASEKDFAHIKEYYPALINAPRDFGPNGKPTLKDVQVNFMNFLDGGPSATRPAGELGKLADILKPAFEQMKKDLQSVDRWDDRQFLDEFFPHFWEDPNAARQVTSNWHGTTGAGHLKQRTHSYIEDGINAELVPRYEPIEASMRYLTQMRKLVAQEKVIEGGKNAGFVKSEPQPGWVKLNNVNRMQKYVDDEGKAQAKMLQYYAPEGWANSWNNITSYGIRELSQGAGDFADYMRKYTNFSTQMMMGFINNFHALTIAESAASMEQARILNSTWAGREGWGGAKPLMKMIASPSAILQYAVRGKAWSDASIGKDSFWSRWLTPAQRKMAEEIMPKAGMRLTGTRHTADWQSTEMGDLITRFMRASTKFAGTDIPTPKGVAQGIAYAAPLIGRASRERFMQSPGVGTAAKIVASDIAATMQASSHWLMQNLVPNVKAGAMAGLVQDYARLNPTASEEQMLKAFREIGDFVDHRMGEAVQDHIYWDKWIKQVMMAWMVSYSWNRGWVNVIGGGLNDQINKQMPGGKGSAAWTPKDHYLMMTIMNSGIMNAIYQKAKTGFWPGHDYGDGQGSTPIRDLLGGRDGGVKYDQMMEGGKPGPWRPLPNRIQMPGIFPKEFAGFAEKGEGMLFDKANAGVNLAEDIATMPRNAQWIGNVFKAIVDRMTPIGYKNIFEDRPAGSNFGWFEALAASRPAKPIISNPDYIPKKAWQEQHYGKTTPDKYLPGGAIKENQKIRDEYIKAHPDVKQFTTKEAKKWWSDKQKGEGYGGANP